MQHPHDRFCGDTSRFDFPVDDLLYLLIREPLGAADDRPLDERILDLSFISDLDPDHLGESIFSRPQGTQSITQSLRKHRDGLSRDVDAGATKDGLAIDRISRCDIVTDICDCHSEQDPTIGLLDQSNRIIEILGILRIDGDKRSRSEIGAPVDLILRDLLRKSIRLLKYFWWKLLTQLMLCTDHLQIRTPGSLRSPLTNHLSRWHAIDCGSVSQSRKYSISVIGTISMAGVDPDLAETVMAHRLHHSTAISLLPVLSGNDSRAPDQDLENLAATTFLG